MPDVVVPPVSTSTFTDPAPAPSAPSPQTSSQPKTAPESSAPKAESRSAMEEAFEDLGKLSTESAAKPEAKKPAPKKPTEPEEQTPDVPEEQEKATDEKPGEQKNKSSVSELRKVYEATKKELYQVREELKKVKESKPVEPPELRTYKERLEAAEKRQAEYEETIRQTSYERSQEYLDKYQKPFEDAYNYAVRAVVGDPKVGIKGLKVQLEDGTTRQAESTDFDRVLMTTDDGDAFDLAEQLFDNKAKIALDHRWEVRKQDAMRYRAIEDAKKNGSEREFKTKEQETKQKEQMGQMWKELNGQAAERFPKFFKPEEGDEDGNRLLEQGYELADAAFSSSNGKSPEEMVRIHASIRNRAAAFTRQVYRTTKLETRVAELEAELKQYQDSEPRGGEPRSTNGHEASWEDALQADA